MTTTMSAPSRDSSKKYPVIVTAAVIREGDKVLITQRQGGPLAGKGGFPGGKLEPDENPEQCLMRELKKEIGIDVRVEDIFAVVYHKCDFGPILLLAYTCKVTSEYTMLHNRVVQWAPLLEPDSFDFTPADAPIVKEVKRESPKV